MFCLPGALGHTLYQFHFWRPGDWVVKVSHLSVSCPRDKTTLDTRAQGSALVGNNTLYKLAHTAAGRIKHCLYNPGRGQLGAHAPCLFAYTDSNLHTCAVINRRLVYNSFSEFCESFWWIIEPEGDPGEPQHSLHRTLKPLLWDLYSWDLFYSFHCRTSTPRYTGSVSFLERAMGFGGCGFTLWFHGTDVGAWGSHRFSLICPLLQKGTISALSTTIGFGKHIRKCMWKHLENCMEF